MSISPVKATEKPETVIDETILVKDLEVEDKEEFLLDSMKKIVNFFQSESTVTIVTPFRGTSLQITRDESKIVIGSEEGRLAIVDPNSQELVKDEEISKSPIWCIALSRDNAFIYTGGKDTVIRKFLLSDLSELDQLEGNKGAVKSIIVSIDDKWMFSASADSTVRMWSILRTSPREITLFKSGGKVSCMDLSTDGRYICSGSSDGNIYIYDVVYNLKSPGKLLTTIKNSSRIKAIKISPSVSFIMSGDITGDLNIFDFGTWNLRSTVNHGHNIRSIDISLAEDFTVAAAHRMIRVHHFNTKDDDITLKKHTDLVTAIAISRSQDKIISLSDDKRIIVSKIPEPEKSIQFSLENCKLKEYWFSKVSMSVEGIVYYKPSEEYFICTWDSKKGERIDLLKLNIEDIAVSLLTPNYMELLIISKASPADVEEMHGNEGEIYYCAGVYSPSQRRKIRVHLLSINPKSAHISSESKYCFIGEKFKISIWNFIDFSIVTTIFAHNGEIIELITDTSTNYLFTYGVDQNLKKFDLSALVKENKASEIDSLNARQSSSYCKLEFSKDGKYLYFIVDQSFKIIDVQTFSIIFFTEKTYYGIFSNLNNTLFLVGDSGMDIYSAKSFQILSTYTLGYSLQNAIISENLKSFYIKTDDNLIKKANPFVSTELTLVGNREHLDSFKDHVNRLIDKSLEIVYTESHWLIEPIHMNLLHLYAHFNRSDIIYDAIKGVEGSESLAFFQSRGFFTPLSIAIQMNLPECINSIVSAIRKIVSGDGGKNIYKMFLFQYLEDSLIDLNLFGYKSLHKLYNEILILETSNYLPNFCGAERKVPLMMKTDYFFPNINEFKLSTDTPDDGKAIVFNKTLLKFYMQMGSKKSLEFINSLTECSNEQIFTTRTVQLILSEKWKIARWYIGAQAALYVAYLILLSLYTSNSDCRTSAFLIAPLAVSSVLYAYELIFVVIDFVEYFTDFWNVVDTIRSWLMTIYAILVWSDYFTISATDRDQERYMLGVLIFVSWVRGITYFRIASGTRYLIKLLFEACFDIISFLIVLLYSVVAFGLVLRAFDSSPDSPFFDYLTTSYIIILGQWTYPGYPNFYSLIIFFATLLNPVISLNLLISLLANTYSNISSNQVVEDAIEQAEMITEVETLMFWNRNKNEKHFLQIMQEDINEDGDEVEISDQIGAISLKIMSYQDSFITSQKTLDSFETKLNGKSQQLLEMLNSLYKKK